MVTFLIIIYILSIWLGLAFPKSNSVFRYIFIIAWILMAVNYDNADYDNYLHKFELGDELAIDVGFGLICQFFKNLGFNYFGFKAVVSFVCLSIVFYSISKLSNKKAMYASLYIFVTLIIDITQFRNFIAYSLVYYAILNLFLNNSFSYLKYILIVMIASSVHATSFFYIFLMFAKYKIKLWHVLIGLYFMFALQLFVISKYQILFETQKVDVRETPTVLGALFTAMPMILYALLFLYCNINNKVYFKQKFTIWKNVSLILLLVIPFYFVNTNFARLFRNIIILDMIFVYDYTAINKSLRFIILFGSAFYFSMQNYFFFSNYYNLVFMPVFKYNILISLL